MNQNVIAGCRIMMRMKNGADATLVGTVFIISAFVLLQQPIVTIKPH
jgi:hypothetical protein